MLLLDKSKWLAVCRACHQWIETHPQEAVERGFSIKRIANGDNTDNTGESDKAQEETKGFLEDEMDPPAN